MALLIERSVFGVLLVCVFALGIGITWVVLEGTFTGNVVQEEVSFGGTYSWTTAVCNEHRQCIDMLIECVDGAVVRMTPVSNLLQFSEAWVDPRPTGTPFCA
ncbi:hypothetical protein EXS73_01590 [Candidatus Pacearchaeota archaeon]|nr:hypothetical protein [Candidatus Pacearchaeota archaeon]